MDQAMPTSMKRRLSFLAQQCWQDVSNQDCEQPDACNIPEMPKLAAVSSSAGSSICDLSSTESDKAPCTISQLDDSLFEPIAFVTPPKKRSKSVSAITTSLSIQHDYCADFRRTHSAKCESVIGTGSSSQHDYRADFQRTRSLPCRSNFNDFNFYGQYQASDMYQPQSTVHGQSTNNSFFQYNSMSTSTSPNNGYNLEPIPHWGVRATADTPMTINRRSSITIDGKTTDATGILHDFEPWFPNPSENDSSDRCPDLCPSSSSMSTSTSCLLDDGNIIISTSDIFKDDNYAKAEVEIISDFNPNESLKSIVGKIKKQKTNNTGPQSRFKPYHEEKWNFHYGELINFKKENGHCLVPHTFPSKPHLARWVKRQRRQYKLRLEGNSNSTMTEERIKVLNDIGFIWDSHEVIWNERFNQLVAYKQKNGHCRVPSYCKECPQLASWVKCQRRQYKLFFEEGKGSSMNTERISLLDSIGFIWEVHPGKKKKENDPHYQHLADILMDT